MILTIVISLAVCGRSAPTWQERYDLGMDDLDEGNYEGAIAAFTTYSPDPKNGQIYGDIMPCFL